MQALKADSTARTVTYRSHGDKSKFKEKTRLAHKFKELDSLAARVALLQILILGFAGLQFNIFLKISIS